MLRIVRALASIVNDVIKNQYLTLRRVRSRQYYAIALSIVDHIVMDCVIVQVVTIR